MKTILSITGSDGTGGVGIQADVQTISALGGKAYTVLTTLVIDTESEGILYHDLPTELVARQVRELTAKNRPQAVKVGLVREAETVRTLRAELVGFRHIVCDPGILSARGTQLVDAETVATLRSTLLPIVEVLIVRCNEAEMLLGREINSDEEMLQAAQALTELGPQWVLMRGGSHTVGRLTALLYGPEVHKFFSTGNVEGWQQHGVGGAMSSAIATRLALGDGVEEAVEKAHEYMHNQVVYSTATEAERLRPAELYNHFLDLIAQHYTEAHDVEFYARRLIISTRYLAEITAKQCGQSPKRVICNYLADKAKVLLDSSHFTVQEISMQLGFANQAHFCKVFLQATEMTPSQYRGRKSR